MTLTNDVRNQIEDSTDFFLTGFLEDFKFDSKEEFEEIRLALLEAVNDKLHCQLYKSWVLLSEDEE